MENIWKNMNNMENLRKNYGKTMEDLWQNTNNMENLWKNCGKSHGKPLEEHE
jgi:hypothetical protein